jgi:hypothetical protein
MDIIADVDQIISLMRKYTTSDIKTEVGEQDGAGGGAAAGGGGSKPAYPTVTKYETGVVRNLANTIDPKSKWSTLYTIKRGKGNTLI